MPTARAIDRRTFFATSAALTIAGLDAPRLIAAREPLSATSALEREGDLAAHMVDGLHAFLDRAQAKRHSEISGALANDFHFLQSAEKERRRLAQIIGAVDPRCLPAMEYLSFERAAPLPAALEFGRFNPSTPLPLARGAGYVVHGVRWPVFPGVDGEGLLLEPDEAPRARIVALPDADWSPEMLVGLAPGVTSESQFARRLAENGCQVIVPTLIDRKDTWSGNAKVGRWTNQPHREFIYRMAYEVGRHILGYEVQKVLAAIDWFLQENAKQSCPIGIMGYGEGGFVALLAAALDTNVAAVAVSGFFGPTVDLPEQPIYRNLWSYVKDFGHAKVAALIVPRGLLITSSGGPEIAGPPAPHDGRGGAAPGRLVRDYARDVADEIKTVTTAFRNARASQKFTTGGNTPFSREMATPPELLNLLAPGKEPKGIGNPPIDSRHDFHSDRRLKRQFDQLVEHTQRLMRQSESKRQEFFWSKLNLQSLNDYRKSSEPLRQYFWEEVIGKLPAPALPANPRTRPLHDTPNWKSYEVTLDLYPDVFAFGILCVPKDLKDGEKRPVVVCQHGLEGRPTNVINPKEKTQYYNSFGSRLADRGFVVFAPQNPYIFQNKFRQLQRKANPLKLSLFSFIVQQHERILDWLATLPFVDDKRMGFYGLSYGGKTAMRVPAILERYCLSICSGDFNEWIWKNTSVDWRGSYMFTPEYEMFEFDLGNTFNYAEMAALVAPRPFMVERGHDDGVGIDEWVAYEYAKVRRLYAKLGIPDRTTIEFFSGGHECHCEGTFAFLHKHLNWPG